MPHDGDDLMERIRQIVSQQKLRCLDGNRVESSPIVELSNKCLVRKVVEGAAPSAYPGFSPVTRDQTNTLKNSPCLQTRRSDTKVQVLRRLHETCSPSPYPRRVSLRSNGSKQDDSKNDAVPNNAYAWRQGQEIIHKYLDVSPANSGSADEHLNNKEQCLKVNDTVSLGFESITHADNEPILNCNPKESIDKRNSAMKPEQSISAPLIASKSKKGLFRPDRTKYTVNNHPGTEPPVQASNHDCATPRAHLRALVKQQKEVRKQERKRQIEAEKEERQRIQRNLQATALAAAAAAKLPVTSNKKISERTPVISRCELQQMRTSVLPLNSYSSEREQKLEELLRREFLTQELHTVACVPPTSSGREPKHSADQDFNETTKVKCKATETMTKDYFLPHRCHVKRNTLITSHTSGDVIPKPRKSDKLDCGSLSNTHKFEPISNSNLTQTQQHTQEEKWFHTNGLQVGTVTMAPAKEKSCESGGDHGLRLCKNGLPKAKSHQQNFDNDVASSISRLLATNNASNFSGDGNRYSRTQKRPYYSEELKVCRPNRPRTISDHVTEAARLDIKLSTQRVKHMLVVDSDDDSDGDQHFEDDVDDDHDSLPSSYGVIKKPVSNFWRQLEAVGPSESEIEEDNVCIVEDIQDDGILDSVSGHRKSFSGHYINGDNLHRTDASHFVKDVQARNEFRNHIYSDPLRFVSVHKRQQKLLHRGGKSHFRSFGIEVNHSEKTEKYARNNVDGSTSVRPRDVRRNTFVTTNSQVVTVECSESTKENILSIKTDEQELFTTEEKNCSQSDSHQQISDNSFPMDPQRRDPFWHKAVNSSQPRLTPAALNLQLTAEMNYLETLAGSMQHIADMESLRHITAAQAECVSLAQMLKARELQISSKDSNKVLEKETQVSGTVFVTPESGGLISGVHSPQFQDILKAAEEFDKIERRLSVKTSHLGSVSHHSSESPSINSKISNQTIIQKSSSVNEPLSDTSFEESDSTRKQSSLRSNKTISNNDVNSGVECVITASDSSDKSYNSFTGTDVGCTTAGASVSEVLNITPTSKNITPCDVEEKKGFEDRQLISVEFNVDTDCPIQRDEINDNDTRFKKSNNQEQNKRRKSKQSNQNEKLHIKSIGIPILDLCAVSPDSSCQTERNDEFNQVKYVLNKRVAALQSRRKKAEELLALSKTLELEEAEVVRLEREALSAIQNKRSALRASRLTEFSRSSNSSKSEKCSKSAQCSKASESKNLQSNVYSTANQEFSYTHYTDEPNLQNLDEQMCGRDHSEAFPTASLGKSCNPSIGDRTKLNNAYEELSAQTLSNTTDLNYCKTDSDSCKSASHSEKRLSHDSLGIHKSVSDHHSENRLLNVNGDNDDVSQVSKVFQSGHLKTDNTIEGTPSLRNWLTNEMGTPSLDRTMNSTSRQLRQRSNSHDSGRRKRVTVPNSVDSLDEDGRVYGIGDDEPFSTVSANSHSDLSELESRIQALNCNLKKQESILCRINLEYKRVHKDRLARLESTLLKHRQLCTEIITNIKADLDVCKASICTESGDSHSKSVNKLLDGVSVPSISPPKSLNKTFDSSNDNSFSCSSSKHIVPLILDKISSSDHTITSKHSVTGEETEPDTLISVAEELVSPQDTDDELNQLELDDDSDHNIPTAEPSTIITSSRNKEISSFLNSTGVINASKQTINSDALITGSTLSSSQTDTFCKDVKPNCEVNDSKSLPNVKQTYIEHVNVSNNDDPFKFSTETADENITQYQNAASIQQMFKDKPSFMETGNFLSNHVTSKVDNVRCQSILDVIHNESECVEMSSTTPLTPPPPPPGNGIVDNTEKIAIVTTENYDKMVVSTVTPCTPENTSLLKIASEHRQREELVNRITSELLTQLVSEAIDSTLNTRKINFKPKCSNDSEIDEDEAVDGLLEDESLQRKSLDSDDSSEESLASLDMNGKLCDEDFEEKISETVKSKICVTPEPSFTEENIQGLFADTPERTQTLIHLAVKHFWDSRLNAALGHKEASLLEALSNPPPEFGFDYCNETDLEIFKTKRNIRFISCALLFDFIGELLQKIYAGEDNETELLKEATFNHLQTKHTHRVSSAQFRLWRGPCRPTTYNHLLNIVTSEVCRELNLKVDWKSNAYPQQQHETNKLKRIGLNETGLSGSRFSRLVQWTLTKKPWLDRILDLELRADEPTWLSYVPEEREIKMKLSNELWEDVLNDALTSVIALNSCKSRK
ncbi:unnamed protein product [Heterobilharzia americana]|nr:unnamed protein product [Heterobilharzia americana]